MTPRRDVSMLKVENSGNHDSSDSRTKSELGCRTAFGRDDYVGAFSLLQRRYLETGIVPRAACPIRVMPYHLWEQTQLFVVARRAQIVGTLSLIRDDEAHRLPIDANYHDEMSRLRNQHHRVGEIVSLAIDDTGGSLKSEIFGELTALMFRFARRIGISHLAAVVHPRHAKFYCRVLGFEIVGGLRRCPHVDGKPGLAVFGDISQGAKCNPRWRDLYVDRLRDRSELQARPMCELDRVHFNRYVNHVVANADRKAA